jgi:hypothetical protein
MSGQRELSDLDPWADSCVEEYVNPDWEPLAILIGQTDIACFTWMGRVRSDQRSLELYRHRTSRRYLNIDQDGNTYQYVDSKYVPVPTSTALVRVLGRQTG